jgi:hypothetical protein
MRRVAAGSSRGRLLSLSKLAATEETMIDTRKRMMTVGEPLPALTLPVVDGGELNLADLRGRKTLLFFWGSW